MIRTADITDFMQVQINPLKVKIKAQLKALMLRNMSKHNMDPLSLCSHIKT